MAMTNLWENSLSTIDLAPCELRVWETFMDTDSDTILSMYGVILIIHEAGYS